MTSLVSDTESNASGFVRFNEIDIKQMYKSVVEGLESINQDMLLIQKNLKNLATQAGPLESQVILLLQQLPNPSLELLPMDTDDGDLNQP